MLVRCEFADHFLTSWFFFCFFRASGCLLQIIRRPSTPLLVYVVSLNFCGLHLAYNTKFRFNLARPISNVHVLCTRSLLLGKRLETELVHVRCRRWGSWLLYTKACKTGSTRVCVAESSGLVTPYAMHGGAIIDYEHHMGVIRSVYWHEKTATKKT
jgi:hypothetical protein